MTSNQDIYSMTTKLAYLTLTVIILFICCTTSYSADDIDDKVIKSFNENSDISNEIDQYKRQGYYEGDISIVGIGGGCGVAGCGRTLLVLQSLTSSGSNPRTISVMAEIHLSPFDEVISVKMVMLVPYSRVRAEPSTQPNIILVPENLVPIPDPVLVPEQRILSPSPTLENRN